MHALSINSPWSCDDRLFPPLDDEYLLQLPFPDLLIPNVNGETSVYEFKERRDDSVTYRNLDGTNLIFRGLALISAVPTPEYQKYVDQVSVQYLDTLKKIRETNARCLVTEHLRKIDKEIERVEKIISTFRNTAFNNLNTKGDHFSLTTKRFIKDSFNAFGLFFAITELERMLAKIAEIGLPLPKSPKKKLSATNDRNTGPYYNEVKVKNAFVEALSSLECYVRHLKNMYTIIRHNPQYMNPNIFTYNDIIPDWVTESGPDEHFRTIFKVRWCDVSAYVRKGSGSDPKYVNARGIAVCESKADGKWNVFPFPSSELRQEMPLGDTSVEALNDYRSRKVEERSRAGSRT
ncbi:MAG: hypothetical protein ACYCOU_12270 [Sulfobacillus sp.]